MNQLESDTRAIARAIAALTAEGDVIDHGTARAIAAQYNDHSTAPFVTTGEIPWADVAGLITDIRRGVDVDSLSADERAALDALDAYLWARDMDGEFDSVDGWSDAWVIKHADYPHETDTLYDCPACDVEDDDAEESA